MATKNIDCPAKKSFMRPADLIAEYGISHASVFRWIKNGNLPAPVRLSPRVIGWPREQIEAHFSGTEGEK